MSRAVSQPEVLEDSATRCGEEPMGESNLFGETTDEVEAVPDAVRAVRPSGPAKLLRAERNQVLLTPTDLEALLAEDHLARGMWRLIGELDLTRFLAAIDSREDEAGRPAIDPRILVTLWLYATSEGVASARELARLSGGGAQARRGGFGQRRRRPVRNSGCRAETGGAGPSRAHPACPGGTPEGAGGEEVGRGARRSPGFHDRPGSPRHEDG